MSELVEMSCVLQVSEVGLMPELVKMLTKAVMAAYTWDSMTVCVGEAEEDDDGRVIMNLTKTVDGEGYENVVARFHRCREVVCRHGKDGGGKPIGEMRLTRLPEVKLDDLLKAREEEEGSSDSDPGGSDRLHRVISDEMFFPSWFDRLREGSIQSQMAPGDLPLWVPEFPAAAKVPVYDVEPVTGKKPPWPADQFLAEEVSKNVIDWGRSREAQVEADLALKTQIQVLKERKEVGGEEELKMPGEFEVPTGRSRGGRRNQGARRASPVRSVSDTAVKVQQQQQHKEQRDRREKESRRKTLRHHHHHHRDITETMVPVETAVVEEKRNLFNLGASFKPFLSFYPLVKKKKTLMGGEGGGGGSQSLGVKRSMSSEAGAERRGRRRGRRRRAEERRPPLPESSTTEGAKEQEPRRFRRKPPTVQ